MYYAPPGLCLNDFSVLATPDGWRLLHLQAPPVEPFDAAILETSYGLAHSSDLVNWEPLGPAFGIARPGAFDDGAIWTMSHVPLDDGGLAMFYTGVTGRPRHRQTVGLARSSRADGTGWLRHLTGPVAEPDSRWYRVDEHAAWRDPFVVHDPEGFGCWVMVVCARAAGLDPERGGCVGLALSDDLENWRVQPPLIVPGDISELECPVLERAPDGGWYLLGSIGPDHRIDAWRAESLTGEWQRLGPVAPVGPYAPRLTDAHGDRLVLHTLERRAGLCDSGRLGRGVLAPPKLWAAPPGAAPHLRWWPGMEKHLEMPSEASAHDASVLLDVRHPERVVIEFAHLEPGPLALTVTTDAATVGYQGRPPLQTAALPRPVESSVRVLRAGEFIEVFLDARLAISTRAYTDSCQGVAARVDGHPAAPEIRAIINDGSGRDDLSAVTPPRAGNRKRILPVTSSRA
jgi:sucrose-6-phosphate hydrolase SacC (GH32 family)